MVKRLLALFLVVALIMTTTTVSASADTVEDADDFGYIKAHEPEAETEGLYIGVCGCDEPCDLYIVLVCVVILVDDYSGIDFFDGGFLNRDLRARYYHPTTGRFSQADTHWNTGNMIYGDNPALLREYKDPLGLSAYTYAPNNLAIRQSGNLYVYGLSNPIMYVDPSGEAVSALLIVGGIIVGAIIAAGTDAACQVIFQGARNWNDLDKTSLVISAVGGAVSGGIGASAAKLGIQIGANVIISGGQSIAYDVATGNAIDYTRAGVNAIASGVIARAAGPGLQSTNVLTMQTIDNVKFGTVVTQTFESSRIAETFVKEFKKNIPKSIVFEITRKGPDVVITILDKEKDKK